MQTVWSRAAQVRASCRCASCTTKTSVTRHSATTASKRPTKYLTTSTLLYSGIFAVAATTDALVKEHRRQRWDDAIANAKEGVEQVQTRLEGLEGTRIFEEAESYQRRSENLESFLDEEDAAYEEPHRIPRGQTWPESSGNDFEQGNFAPQSAWASPQYQARWKARAWTPKKIHLTELAIDKLTLRILLQLDKQDLQDVVLDSFSEDFRRLISRPRRKLESLLGLVNRRIRETKAIDPKEDETAFAEIPGVITRYRQDINSHYLDTAAAVEKSVMRTFNRHSAGHLSNTQLVLDTLHSLVTSSAPPSLGTFNQMIEGFSKKLLDPSITQNVINAMRGCSTRINETTLISILEHYIRTNHYARFCYHVELMQGMHGGLSLARPDIWITEKSQERLVPTVHIRNNNKIIVQKPVANPVVFSTLIQGVLHFEGFDAALDMCQSMGRDGWGLSMKGLTPLLRECARRGSWDTGMAVWTQIKRVQALSQKNRRPELIQSWTYATMLRLCVACHKRLDFSRILEDAVKTRHISRNALLNQVKRLSLAQDEQSDSVIDIKQQRQNSRSAQQEQTLEAEETQSAPSQRRSIRWRNTQELLSHQALRYASSRSRMSSGSDQPHPNQVPSQSRSTGPANIADTISQTQPSKSLGDQGVDMTREVSSQSDFLSSTSLRANQLSAISAEGPTDYLHNMDPDSVILPDPLAEKGSFQSEAHRSPDDRSLEVGESTPRQNERTHASIRARPTPRIFVRREQLMGMVQSSQDLDDWEVTERPMNLMSATEPRLYI